MTGPDPALPAFGSELKFVHCLPALYTLGLAGLLTLFIVFLVIPVSGPAHPIVTTLLLTGIAVFAAYQLLLFSHALYTTRSLKVACMSVLAVFVQFTAYGLGFLSDLAKQR